MESLGKLLNKRIQGMQIQPKVTASLVIEKFNEVLELEFGAMIKSRARALYMRQDYLYVAVLSSIISSEIKMRESNLVIALNEKLGAEIIKKLRYIA